MSPSTAPYKDTLVHASSDSRCPVCDSVATHVLLQAPDRFHGRSTPYRLLSCPACSLVSLADPPLPENMGEHYGADYDRFVTSAGDDPRRWTSRVATIGQYKTGGVLLDLGCSSGGFLQGMRSPAWTLHGLEMSNAVATRAEAASGATVFVGDILEAPYHAASFDVITAFHVLEHVYEPLSVLRKIAYWLKPGGIFYFMVPNIESAGLRIFKSYWSALELPRHLYHYSPRSLTMLANTAGLEELSLTTHRELFFEESVGYLVDNLCARVGIPRPPRSRRLPPSLAFRVVRKGFRLTAVPMINGLAALIGDGESIHGILRKPEF